MASVMRKIFIFTLYVQILQSFGHRQNIMRTSFDSLILLADFEFTIFGCSASVSNGAWSLHSSDAVPVLPTPPLPLLKPTSPLGNAPAPPSSTWPSVAVDDAGNSAVKASLPCLHSPLPPPPLSSSFVIIGSRRKLEFANLLQFHNSDSWAAQHYGARCQPLSVVTTYFLAAVVVIFVHAAIFRIVDSTWQWQRFVTNIRLYVHGIIFELMIISRLICIMQAEQKLCVICTIKYCWCFASKLDNCVIQIMLHRRKYERPLLLLLGWSWLRVTVYATAGFRKHPPHLQQQIGKRRWGSI